MWKLYRLWFGGWTIAVVYVIVKQFPVSIPLALLGFIGMGITAGWLAVLSRMRRVSVWRAAYRGRGPLIPAPLAALFECTTGLVFSGAVFLLAIFAIIDEDDAAALKEREREEQRIAPYAAGAVTPDMTGLFGETLGVQIKATEKTLGDHHGQGFDSWKLENPACPFGETTHYFARVGRNGRIAELRYLIEGSASVEAATNQILAQLGEPQVMHDNRDGKAFSYYNGHALLSVICQHGQRGIVMLTDVDAIDNGSFTLSPREIADLQVYEQLWPREAFLRIRRTLH